MIERGKKMSRYIENLAETFSEKNIERPANVSENPLNPMCNKCKCLHDTCSGTKNQVYTGCIYKR